MTDAPPHESAPVAPEGASASAGVTAAAGPACGATCGVTRQREREKLAARALAARAYPGLVWTPRPAWAPDEPPVSDDEARALASALGEVLPTRAWYAAGEPGAADEVVLLAGLHAPCWLEGRDAGGLGEGREPPRVGRETYLRVALSPLGRFATLQELRVTADRDAGGAWVEERSLAGVEDRRLQLFVKAAQGVLRKQKLTALDAAFLAEEVPDPHGAATRALGAPPTLRTLLFERAPAGTVRGEFVPFAPGG